MRKTLAFLCILFVCIMVLGLMPINGETELYDNIIRLHVIANSDSMEDQKLKLIVRDEILKATSHLIKDCKTYEEAENVLNSDKSLLMLKNIAENTMQKQGFNYKAEVTLGHENYPFRSYSNMCFPKGNYMSLQIKIGKSNGKNFWCVLFPTLCLSIASEENKNAFIDAGFTKSQYNIITESNDGEYQIKFKILEIMQDIVGNK